MLKEKAFPLQRIWEVLSCGPTWQTSGGGAALNPPPRRSLAESKSKRNGRISERGRQVAG